MWSTCQKRITNSDLTIYFEDGKHIVYLETYCGNPVYGFSKQNQQCNHCESLKIQTKAQDLKSFPHGFVNDLYPSHSHIFDSPWYHEKVEAYGPPSKEDIDIAMEAQRRAREGKKTKSIKELVATLFDQKQEEVVEEKIVLVKKPKLKIKREENQEQFTQAIPTQQPQSQQPKPTPEFIETMDDPIEVNQIIKIQLKPINEEYWKDETSNKVYVRTITNSVGDFVGIWDPESECVQDL